MKRTGNERDVHVLVTIYEDINDMFEGNWIQQQRRYVLKHDPCNTNTLACKRKKKTKRDVPIDGEAREEIKRINLDQS